MSINSARRQLGGRRIHQREIAERAGVSASTVSRVLNNIPGISDEVQRRVRAVAADLGYLQRVAAQPGKMRRISMFTSLSPNARSLDPFHSDVLSGIEAECQRQEINLTLTILKGPQTPSGMQLEQVDAAEGDGLLLLSVDDQPLIQRLCESERRLVVVNAEYPGMPIDMFLPDNHFGVLRAIRLLISRGHRRILHVTSLHRRTFHLRLNAYRAALEEAGIPFDPALVLDTPLGPETAQVSIRERLANGARDFTAVFCANDASAMGVMRGLQEAGLRVPEDVSIIGYDDIPTSAFLSPPLTTVRIEREELGALAVRRLVDRANFPNLTPLQITMATRLIERASVAEARPL